VKKDVELYDSHYQKLGVDVYQTIRAEAFGVDLGQTSWITAAECDEFCRWLGLRDGLRILEVACGSGGVAVRLAQRYAVSVVGVDVNESAVSSAMNRAELNGVMDRVHFQVADASQTLPFPADSFDVVFCNDSINHFRDRKHVLSDWHRVLRAGGHCLYTDPIVVTGSLSNAEIAVRSSIGFFLFTPVGVNEQLIREAGFRLRLTADATDGVAITSRRWHDARAERRSPLSELEGETKFEELQEFLAMVHRLAHERRLSRFAFMGEKVKEAV
jgi:SAM-dependent methyltransferase